jgi:hypothetical protein
VLAALVWSGPGHADAPPGRYCITPGPTPAETIVRDSATGLTWLQPVAPGVRPWAEAITYCDGLGAAGKSWRLPSVKELLTLGDETGVAPAVDPTAFPDTPMGSFWSISTRPDDPTLAWSAAGMGNNAEKKTVQNLVRCVMR